MLTERYISTLTPLRGIAAILVVVFHSHLFVYPVVKSTFTGFIGSSWLWVDFFFVLSGFIMMHVYGRNFESSVRLKEYGKYIWARFSRVYPLHFFTMIWVIIVGRLMLPLLANDQPWTPFFNIIFDYGTILPSVFMLQAMHFFTTAPLNTPSWSLSTEWWMYVIFPLLVSPFFQRKYATGIAVVFVIALFVTLKYYIVPTFGMHLGEKTGSTINTINDFAFLRCMAGFILGMITYQLYRLKKGQNWLRRDVTFLLSFVAIAVSMQLDWNELIVVALFPVVILSAAENDATVRRILEGKVWQRLGDWSFSIYMVHVPIILTFTLISFKLTGTIPGGLAIGNPDYFTGWMYCLGTVAITLLVSSLTFRFVEGPARRYLNDKVRKPHEEFVEVQVVND